MTTTVARGRVRVAQIIHGAGLGGTERHLRSLLEGLPDHGVEPILIVSSEGLLLDLARSLGLESYLLPRSSAWSYLNTLTRRLETLRLDAVHAHSGRLPCIAARRAGIPRIIETRHGALHGVGRLERWSGLALTEGWKCRMAHQTVTVCEADRDWLIRSARLDPARVRTVLNGIRSNGSIVAAADRAGELAEQEEHDLDCWREKEGERQKCRRMLDVEGGGRWIGFVGRLSPEKAPGRILHLMRELLRRDPEWRALIVGDGPEMRSLRELARRYQVDEAIVWLGGDPRGEVAIRSVECVCLPSVNEGLPYVLLEALAAGVPVLATPVGGIPEVLSGVVLQQGCLKWDAPDWARRVEELTGPLASKNWEHAARQRVATLDEASMLRSLAAIYRGDGFQAS